MKNKFVLFIFCFILVGLAGCGAKEKTDQKDIERNVDSLNNLEEELIDEQPLKELPEIKISDEIKKLYNEKIFSEGLSIDLQISKGKLEKQKPINLLFVLQSDDLMSFSLLAIDPKSEDMQLIILPGEIKTTIRYQNGGNDLYSAYYAGVGSYSAAAVRTVLGVDVDYYIYIDTNGIKDIIEEIGPIAVNNQLFHNDQENTLMELDSSKITNYINETTDDLGFVYQQHKLIEGLTQNILQDASSEKLESTISIMSSNAYMDTNIDFEDMKKVLTEYRLLTKTINPYELNSHTDNFGYLENEEIEEVRKVLGNNAYFSEARYASAEDRIELSREYLEIGVSVQPESKLTYENNEFGFSLELPQSWENRYIVWEIEDPQGPAPTTPAKMIVFSMVENGKYIGDCLFITVFDNSVDEVKTFYDNSPMFEEFIAAKGNVSLVTNRPAELPIPLYEEQYLDLADRFVQMVHEDYDQIVKTIKFN